MSFTNAQLAQKISDLIDYWASFNEEHANWLGGAVDGGPNSDGEFPLTDYTGQETLVKSPAKLQDDVDNITSGATAQANAAAASAAAAATSESNAATSATDAYNSELAAQAAQSVATTKEASAVNAANTAVTQANLATDRVGYASEWANAPFETLVSAAAGGDQVDDYSALHWATVAQGFAGSIDSNLYGQLAQNEIVSGNWSFTSQDTRFGNATPYVARALSVADSGIVVAELSRNANTGMIVDLNLNSATAATNAFGLRFQQQASLKGFVGAYPSTYGGVVGIGLTYSTSPYVTFHTPASGGMRYWNSAGSGYAQLNYDDPNFSIDKPLDVTGAIAATGAVTGSNLNVANWDTAYGWGDHSVAGYATVASGTFDGAVTAGNDSNTRGEVLIYADNLTSPLNDDALAPGRLWLEGRGAYNDWNVQPWQNFLYFYTDNNTISTPSFTLQSNGNAVFLGSVTASGGNSANWNTAYGWGDHAGLYEPVDASLVRSGTLTQEDNYTYLNRNNAANPVLHVAQVGTGPIAIFGKAPSLGSTGYTAEITFGSDGAITAEGLTVNDVTQTARLNIVHTTSGNTHFNWSNNGENYITHKNTGFTRFRGFDGVSTYTTRAEMSDADFEIHVLTKVNQQILAGSGYGSAGTPSFSSTQDANTGMYVSASDTLGFSTGGIERVKIDVNGLTMVAAGADLILGNNSLTADNVSSSVGDAPLKIGNGTGSPMVWGQYCSLGRTYSAARTGLANNAYVDSDDAVSGQWRHLVTHGSYGHTILELAGGAFYFYGNSNSVTAGNIVSKNQRAQLDQNGFKVAGSNVNPGAAWSSLSSDMLHIDGKEVIDGNDTWLRINMNGDFTSGTYLPTAWHFANVMRRYNKGAYLFHDSSSYAGSGVGAITFSTSAATGGSSGDIWFQYT